MRRTGDQSLWLRKIGAESSLSGSEPQLAFAWSNCVPTTSQYPAIKCFTCSSSKMQNISVYCVLLTSFYVNQPDCCGFSKCSWFFISCHGVSAFSGGASGTDRKLWMIFSSSLMSGKPRTQATQSESVRKPAAKRNEKQRRRAGLVRVNADLHPIPNPC